MAMPASRAASNARTTPAIEASSVIASARYPSAFARANNSFAELAPRRKLKFERQCSSA